MILPPVLGIVDYSHRGDHLILTWSRTSFPSILSGVAKQARLVEHICNVTVKRGSHDRFGRHHLETPTKFHQRESRQKPYSYGVFNIVDNIPRVLRLHQVPRGRSTFFCQFCRVVVFFFKK